MTENASNDTLKLRTLSEVDTCSEFDCGESLLNDFIHKEAQIFQEEKLAVTYLAYLEEKLIGFVAISMASVKTEHMELNHRLGKRIENFPALQISQLAIDKPFQRSGIGRRLINWSMLKAIECSKITGCRLLVLNALPASVDFYKKCDFIELKRRGKRKQKTMYLVIPKEMFTDTGRD